MASYGPVGSGRFTMGPLTDPSSLITQTRRPPPLRSSHARIVYGISAS